MSNSWLYLVWGTRGEYSDRSEWPVAVYPDENSAQAAVIALKEAARDLYALYRSREDELDKAGDWDGATLLTTTEEGRRFAELHSEAGGKLAPGNYSFNDMDFTCLAVPFRSEDRP